MLVVDGPNGTTDMSSDSTVTTVTPQSQDEPIDITGATFSVDYSPYEDSDTDAEEVIDHWRRLDPEIPRPAPSAFPFTGNPGFKIPTANLKDPVDYFNLFFDDEVVQYIVSETNRSADQFLQTEEPSSRSQKWYETNDKEFRIFLAILLYQGIVKKPKEEWYWSRRPCLSTPIIGELMPYRRFRNLNLFLYSSGNDPHPVINKIYEVCNLLCNKFQDVYVPEREVTIDELFAPSKGRPCYKEHTPTEKDRLGIRIYELCESRSGYVWNMMVCTGKDAPFEYNGKKYDTATRYVITLVKDILNKGYCLSVDNSYISPELTEFLISHKTDIYETLRPSKKKLPTFSNTENVAVGESVAFQKGKMRVSEWQGNEPECIISSLHYDEMMRSSSSQTAPQKQEDVDCNIDVGSFDYSDLYASCYPHIGKQPKEHYKKIFRHLLNQAVWNSFVLYRKTGGTTKLLEFRLQLLEELIKHNKETNMHPRIPGTLPESSLRLTERHFPSLVPQRGRKANPCRKCVVCTNIMDENGKRKRRESRYECKKCDRGLCVTPCFEIYHTVEEL